MIWIVIRHRHTQTSKDFYPCDLISLKPDKRWIARIKTLKVQTLQRQKKEINMSGMFNRVLAVDLSRENIEEKVLDPQTG